jgi:tRNA nucleotidyltransferase (CCA-adding enzyme)
MKTDRNMRIFRVGGCVRDRLMGVHSQDIDYVVTGATEEQLLAAKPFGEILSKIEAQNFPVYHDSEGNEWALARRERKVGQGYHGFAVEFGPEVSIENDCERRDLTINSMAEEVFDDMKTRLVHVIDPFNGQEDLKNKVLRHTSAAFEEDPVRVLRLARFRARFGPEWTVAPETVALVASMAKKGSLSELTAERVWKELSRALMEAHPRLFFDTLLECDALHVLFPEIYQLKTALEARSWHPEGDTFSHTQLVLTQAAEMGYDLETRVMCLVHDLGKGVTPRDQLPKHYGHDIKGVPIARDFLLRLKAPSDFSKHAEKVTRYHMAGHRLDQMNPKTFVKMFDDMGIQNDPRVVDLLYRTFQCDARGRLGSEKDDISHLDKFLDIAAAYRSVKFVDVFPTGETNVNKIKDGLYRARVQAIGCCLNSYK